VGPNRLEGQDTLEGRSVRWPLPRLRPRRIFDLLLHLARSVVTDKKYRVQNLNLQEHDLLPPERGRPVLAASALKSPTIQNFGSNNTMRRRRITRLCVEVVVEEEEHNKEQ